MDTSISAIPDHMLLNRKDDDDKAAQSVKKGASSAFAEYTFGPLDLSNGKTLSNSDAAASTSSVTAATGGGIGWMAQIVA